MVEDTETQAPRLFRAGECTVTLKLEEGETEADAEAVIADRLGDTYQPKQYARREVEQPTRSTLAMIDDAEGQRYAYTTLATDLNDADLLKYCYAVYKEASAGQDKRLSVSPNWLLSAAQPGGNVVGGPGALPVAVTNVNADSHRFKVSNSLGTLQTQERIEELLTAEPGDTPVTVAILDTVPGAHAIGMAANNFPQNTLLQELVAKAPHALRLTYMPINLMSDTLDPQHGVHVANSHYGFSDHGLFVAGIIQTLAPNANLHLIQVLNDYAAGTLESLVWGFEEALRTAPPDAPLIVNCSLTVSIPNSRTYLDGTQVDEELVRFFEEMEDNDPDFITWLARTAQQAVAAIASRQQAAVIAAAGNEGDTVTARYPGAYDEVYGVGALNHDLSRAAYSNVADSPIGQGFAAYGGNTDSGTGNAHNTTGMLGLYIGNFPDGSASQTGWGRWAGTSFASPVVAGLAAALCSQGHTPDDAHQQLRDLLLSEAPDSPDVLPITQNG